MSHEEDKEITEVEDERLRVYTDIFSTRQYTGIVRCLASVV